MKNYEEILNTITTEQWEAIAAYASEKVSKVTISEARKDKSNGLTLEQRVINLLHQIGCPPHLNGYYYLKYAVILAYNQKSYLKSVTKELYPTVAGEFRTTVNCVARAIRHAVEYLADNGDLQLFEEIFTMKPSTGKPTNIEAIACMVEYLKNN